MKRLLVFIIPLMVCCSKDGGSDPGSGPTAPPTPFPITTPSYLLITQTIHEAQIEICDDKGGTVETSGFDKNDNMILDTDEMDSITTICDIPIVSDDEGHFTDCDFECWHHKHGRKCKRKKK